MAFLKKHLAMRIYLDCCCLQRPLDDLTQPRINVEAEAILGILAAVQAGDISLVSSNVLEYEVGRIPHIQRRGEVNAILALASERMKLDEESARTAESLEAAGVKPMDALHLAIASVAHVDFFGTCDDRLLKLGRRFQVLDCNVVSVLELIREVTR